MTDKYYLGIDIGSISINTVVLDRSLQVIDNEYTFCHGKPFSVLLEQLKKVMGKYSPEKFDFIAFTGTGGELAEKLVGGKHVNEIIAQSSSVSRMYPEARTVIEMGGEDSKLIFMKEDEPGLVSLSDFSLNTICAAGTGSFLDQQAKRIGVSIVDEFGEMALKSENPPRIAGRCSVFAKSDMIHLQQIATPVQDIVAGLCFAVARNFISTLGRGKKLDTPVIFQGGVAANQGVVRAFTELLKVSDGELIIPEYHASMGALGAVFYLLSQERSEIVAYKGLGELEDYLKEDLTGGKRHDPLVEADVIYNKESLLLSNGQEKLPVYLGLDIGSLSTNVVLIDDKNNVVARRYLPTASKPIEAIRRGMSEIYEEVGNRVVVMGAGTTGSGRYLTGDFVGADVIRNEITAQATAAIAHDATVDTIFEIGGQDSKYISIDQGVVVDFEMNKVCAAGTGSFLEEQAEKLDISIVEEFGHLALSAKRPAAFGNRCTVFMETDLNSHQQKGVEKENLVGGLAYSIVENYIQKVVRKKRIGNKIFFQGGVTNNKAVVAAFEKVTGKKIIVPPHFDVTGAIGVAILARDHIKQTGKKTSFKGFDISKIPYSVDRFTCKSCANQCEIRRVRIEGEKKPLYFGGRCEMWEKEDRKGKGEGIPNLFEERLELLLNGFTEKPADGKITIGIPRALAIFWQTFPFWRTFFETLGFNVVLSDESNNQLISKSLEMIVAETCFPIELAHGHVQNLLDKGVDYVWMPFIINMKSEESDPTRSFSCPWIQTFPFMVKAAIDDPKVNERLLIPALNFRFFGKVLDKELADFMKKRFGLKKGEIVKAIGLADKAQETFDQQIAARGREVLASLPEDKESLVIIGRSYNTGDPSLNLSMVEKLINMDVMPIPIDFIPWRDEKILEDYPQMYWHNGAKVLAAARFVAKHKDLHAIYMGNFRCGPDSFLSHFVNEEMQGKPYMELEIDEHSADAGMITRYEAFLDSLEGSRKVPKRDQKFFKPGVNRSSPLGDRTLYFPNMADGAHGIAAACRHFGMKADVLPPTTKEDIDLAKKYCSARECFPMIATTGSFLAKLNEPGVDGEKISFFMPDHNGPCRFGQYNKFQRVVFNRLGFENVEIISPRNDASYEDISGGHGTKFRILAWKGIVAFDILRRLRQERQPYNVKPGDIRRVYNNAVKEVVASIERGGADLYDTLARVAVDFNNVPLDLSKRKPVIAVVGEFFMRDNASCSSYLLDRLENLGAETFENPFSEWMSYSTYRYFRDSKWKGDTKGMIKSRLQEFTQETTEGKLYKAVKNFIDQEKVIHVNEMLDNCGEYIHKHYDGDPAITLGTSVMLMQRKVSGFVNILPFTCMPGTFVESVSHKFKHDFGNIPYENFAYEGQDDTSIDLRLQALMYRAKEYCARNGYDKPDNWHLAKIAAMKEEASV